MHKSTIVAALALLFTCSIMAQNNTIQNKHGIAYLPQAYDWAIGADASPYLEYLGNLFNGTENNELDLGNQNLYFRYYITNKSAIRINLSIGNSTNKEFYYINNEANIDPLNMYNMVEDMKKTQKNSYSVLIGLQKSRGYGRLKGFYGLQVGYQYSKESIFYEYGNAFSAANQTPGNYWDFETSRPTEINKGKSNGITGGGFVGVEFYILPKICIGGECSLMYTKTWQSQSYSTFEQWSNDRVISVDIPETPGNKTSNLETARPATYSGLYLMFHF
ncbi:hypothetical protein [Plebeiibacterium marinum]|uniref:Outer membrane protein beta-barrel domain-containing protein n=1 Tax=Plebeiibacterium marinum TaxID=2992111 RepID=A0AAE3MGF9_9BACT|nr:hypothetical protein [Plebeiobacterium marinum]MCW3807192.1 hypothetical protein [Plebeiobacterium marinum]